GNGFNKKGGGTKKGFPGGSPIISPGRLNTGCAPLAAPYPTAGLIQRAYGRLPLGRVVRLGSSVPISGGPAWIYSDYYTINAEAPGNASEAVMEGPMLQALLEDRFRLRVHRQTRQVPVYALTVAKGGPKIKPITESNCVARDYSKFPPPPPPPGKRPCFDMIARGAGPNAKIRDDESTSDYFTKLLGLALDRPVIDRTGLTGKYNLVLEFAVDQATARLADDLPTQPSDEPPAPSIFTAVEEQLGLRLVSTRGPREFLVIDHIERPSEN
ncbi:MAG: TIGR03435 family protein, partial [Acidobacteriia bacterium]|nr:TIGR03435 family protein [Terriglobia bacterium]